MSSAAAAEGLQCRVINSCFLSELFLSVVQKRSGIWNLGLRPQAALRYLLSYLVSS